MNHVAPITAKKKSRIYPGARNALPLFRQRKARIWENNRGDQRIVYRGWSWPAFVFGFFWFIHTKVWTMVVLIIAATSLLSTTDFLFQTAALGHLLFGLAGNKIHERHLRSQNFRLVPRSASNRHFGSGNSDSKLNSHGTQATRSAADARPWIHVDAPDDGLLEPLVLDQSLVPDDSEFARSTSLHSTYVNEYPESAMSQVSLPEAEYLNNLHNELSNEAFEIDVESPAELEPSNHVMRIGFTNSTPTAIVDDYTADSSLPEPGSHNERNDESGSHEFSAQRRAQYEMKAASETDAETEAAEYEVGVDVPHRIPDHDFARSILDCVDNEDQRRLVALKFLQQQLKDLESCDQQISTTDLKRLLWHADCELLESDESLKIRDWDSNLIPSANMAAIPQTISYLIWTHYDVHPET